MSQNLTVTSDVTVSNITVNMTKAAGLRTESASAITAAVFFIYCVGLIAYLWFVVKNDTIFGMVIRCRKKQASMKKIKIFTWLQIVAILIPPIIITIVWSTVIVRNSQFPVVAVLSVCFWITYPVCMIIGFTHWQSNKWYLKAGVGAIFGLAIICCVTFAFAVSCLGTTYSHSGASAIILSVNFIPACFLAFQKTQWSDNDIKLLYESIAKEIAHPDYKTKIAQPEYDEMADLKSTIDINKKHSQRHFKFYFIGAAIFYLITLVVYFSVVFVRENNSYRYTGISTPVFLIFTDLVILSLRERPVSVDGKNSVKELQITDIVYSSTFQSFFLFLVRLLLCFNVEYWLIVYSFIYVIVQIVGSFDLSYAIFSTTEVMGNEQEDILALYKAVPLVQASTKIKMDELHTRFESEPKNLTRVIRRFRTTVCMLLYCGIFIGLNVIASKQPKKLKSATMDMGDKSAMGQEVWGGIAICLSFVITLFIIWMQAFQNDRHKLTLQNTIIYAFLQAASIGLGIVLYWLTTALSSVNVNLSLVTFILMPGIIVSYTAFYGLWKTNDYRVYEDSQASFDFFVQKQKLGFCASLKLIPIKPKTRKDKFALALLCTNLGTIALYISITMALYTRFFGFTIGCWLLIIELTIILAKKYEQNNYSYKSTGVVLCLSGVLLVFLTWILVIILKALRSKDKPQSETEKGMLTVTVVASVVYFFGALLGVLLEELVSKKMDIKKRTVTFYVNSALLLLILIGVGLFILIGTSQGLIGILWLSAILYLVLNFIVPYRFKWIIDVSYCAAYVGLGIATSLYEIGKTSKLVAMSTIYAGFFILAFGQFCRSYLKNMEKKAEAILLYNKWALPIQKYSLTTQKMALKNKEGYLFFACFSVVELWGFSATAVAERDKRYIPIAIMSGVIGLAFIYLMTKVNDLSTLDGKLFKQANMSFYICCLADAVSKKKEWRNNALGIDEIKDQTTPELGPMYLNELGTVNIWRRSLHEFLERAGYLSLFDHSSLPIPRDTKKVTNEVGPESVEFVLQPEELKTLIQNVREAEGDAFVDKWLALVEKTRNEMVFDNEFWAFLNGYSEIKMNHLLEAQSSIVTTLFQSFIKIQKRASVIASMAAQQSGKVDDAAKKRRADIDVLFKSKSLTKFAHILQRDKEMLLDFTEFVANQFFGQNKKTEQANAVKELAVGSKLPVINEVIDIFQNCASTIQQIPGDVMLLAFWSSADAKCVEAMTAIKQVQEKNKDAWAQKVRLVAISQDERAEDVIVKDAELGLQAIEHFKDTAERKISKVWGVNIFPHCVLIDKNGTITWRGQPSEINVETEINKLLAAEMQAVVAPIDLNLSEVEKQLKDILVKGREEFTQDPHLFDPESYQYRQLQLIDKLVEDRTSAMQARIKEAFLKEKEKIKKREEAEKKKIAEREAQKQKQREQEQKKKEDIQVVTDLDEDQALLKKIGDEKYGSLGKNIFNDEEFEQEPSVMCVMGDNWEYKSFAEGDSSKTAIFESGISGADIRQGKLGDCYLLSAMSCIAHQRPELIERIFHSSSRVVQRNGMYHLRFFQGRQPVIITVDDKIYQDENAKHAFVQVQSGKDGVKEMWPILIEKAYAKMFGSYEDIQGGHPSDAITHMTNAVSDYWVLDSEPIKKQYTSGELWKTLVTMREQNYLLAAGSPAGSDTDSSELGVVQGHAYSILDVAEIDGNKLLQMRNPWGNSEWTGAWSDGSKDWNHKRKQQAYEHMKLNKVKQVDIGADDGVFWISFSDFNSNFKTLYYANIFDNEEYNMIELENEWNAEKGSAGGCTNYDSFVKNPQYKLSIVAKDSPTVELTMLLALKQKPSGEDKKKHLIGLRAFDNAGQAVTDRNNAGTLNFKTQIINKETIKYDGKFATTKVPLTLVLHQFYPEIDDQFTFTIWYKLKQGEVKLEPF